MSLSTRCMRQLSRLRVFAYYRCSSRFQYTAAKCPQLPYGHISLNLPIRCYSDISDKDDGDEKQTLSKLIEKDNKVLDGPSSSSDSDSDSDSSSSSDEEALVDPELKHAAKAVAEALPGDKDVTHLDLLQKLQAYASITEAQKGGLPQSSKKSDLSKLVSGMKVEQKEPKRDRSLRNMTGEGLRRSGPRERRAYQDGDDEGDLRPMRQQRRDRQEREGGFGQRLRPQKGPKEEDIKLFDGPRLGIFIKDHGKETRLDTAQTLYDQIEADQIAKQTALPPNNPFEEMMLLTKQGKLWKFPIDNEQDMEIEKDVGFHQHVFLDHHLEDFPKKGPIRHFMELVVTGLSKNAYLTIQQKAEHIEWFKEYFKDKYKIVDALIVDSGSRTEKEDTK